MDRTGNLLVGTESPGKVIRVDSDGKGFVLLDTPYQEIRGLRFDDKGQLYAAALNGRPGGAAPAPSLGTDQPLETGRAPVPSVSVSTEITAIAIVDGGGSSSTSGSSRDDRRSSKGAVYRIMPDGLWDMIWDSREDVPYDVAFDRSGAPIVATGNKGKLYRLEGDPIRPTLLTRASAQQVTAFYAEPRGQLYFATANPGKLFRLSAEHASRGTYESEPADAQMLATWGTLSWRGTVPNGTKVELATRSGNTITPDVYVMWSKER
jgi:hypothetical protein